MANSTVNYDEFRIDVRDPQITKVWVCCSVGGDSPMGIQGWHHKSFPARMTVMDILETMFGVNGKERDDPILWGQEARARLDEEPPAAPTSAEPEWLERLRGYIKESLDGDDPFYMRKVPITVMQGLIREAEADVAALRAGKEAK